MHNQSTATTLPFAQRFADLESQAPVIRPARRSDVDQIHTLVSEFVGDGSMLPRTADQIALNIDNYVVADKGGRVVACAALEEYSPSLAEVSSVAVSRDEHGQGLGTQVVLGVERLARARDIEEIFALSLTDRFFLGLDYAATAISRYPEKLSRYEKLTTAGVQIVPKRCFQKRLGGEWQIATRPLKQTKRARRAS
ncbi:MAG TPA: GNAT family N-acetyltransferase [Gemmatimonadaceae bacterium]|nr:GNAT family N-acetyltransferase [Gemmatimonadaceae bacterium]